MIRTFKLQNVKKLEKGDPLETKTFQKKSRTQILKQIPTGGLVVLSGFAFYVKNGVNERGTICTNLDAFSLAGLVIQ